MQISLQWINELVNIKTVQLDNLIEKLTLGGFEVEEILKIEINNETHTVLDISATANRSDSLSVQGIAIEIAALLDKPTKKLVYTTESKEWQESITKQLAPILSDDYCSTLLCVTVENLNDFTVPLWIKEKLISSGVTPTNDLTDFQSYILLETGYPFSFYDLNKISSKINRSRFNLSISNAIKNQQFIANNDKTYELNESNFLVKINDLPISIAGIIENKEFSYSKTTNSLLIEGSIFNAAKVRQQSRNLGLRTDKSARYEKSLKNTYLIESLYRLILLLRVKNPNLICKIHTLLETEKNSLQQILLHYKTINEILGPIKKNINNSFTYLSSETITSYLERLNFKFSYDQSKLIWNVQIPHLRSDDLTQEIDLIEEIGRLHGFNNFLTTLPKIQKIGLEDISYKTRKKVTSCLLNLGFNELIHYSLVNEKTFIENKINLVNPLLLDYSHLRSSLLPSLIETVKENLKHSNKIIEGFEYGHVFSGNIEENVTEVEHIAGIFGGVKVKLSWSENEKELTWFEAKGKIEQLFKQLNLLIYWKTNSKTSSNHILHPYRSAEISFLTGERIGVFGQIHPILANQLSIRPGTYLFEFNLPIIETQIQRNKLPIYKEYPLYPKIVKDLSFIIQQNITFSEIKEIMYLNGTKFLSEIKLLDEYRGQSIPDQYTSLCLQLTFQSNEKTLQNKEIESIIDNLQLLLINNFDVILRD